MQYTTILTSKGTTTIPAEVRRKLGIKPGMYVSFSQDEESGDYKITRSQTIDEIRSINKAALKLAHRNHKEYQTGDGFTKFIRDKYDGKSSGA